MPELPEVETIAKQLQTVLPFKINKVILSPVVDSILKTKNINPCNDVILHSTRYGKQLFLELASGSQIISGLGMSGSWRISRDEVLEKHAHIRLSGYSEKLKTNLELAYIDPRRFGLMHWLNGDEASEYKSQMGVDITSDAFTQQYLYEVLKRFPNRKLKVHLLDQKYFGGVGNYMASEICAHAGIRPTRLCGKVTKKEIPQLHKAFSTVLDDSVASGGNTFSGGYTDAFGDAGEGVKNLVVFYQKTCGLCSETTVKKITLGQRGTYYCPVCQK